MRRLGHLVVATLVAALLAAAALLPAPARAQEDSATLERRVKAAFIYKFAGYVDWPEGALAMPDGPLTIGVLGDEVMAAELAQVTSGRTSEGHPLIVRRLRAMEAPDALAGVHVLFVGQGGREALSALRSFPSQPILVISETDKGLNQGSVINFVISGGRVRFEVALDNAEKRNLKLSSRLLSVAHFVRTGAPP